MRKNAQKMLPRNANSVCNIVHYILQDDCIIQRAMGAQAHSASIAIPQVRQHALQFHTPSVQWAIDSANYSQRINVFEFREKPYGHLIPVALAQEEWEVELHTIVGHHNDIRIHRSHMRQPWLLEELGR